MLYFSHHDAHFAKLLPIFSAVNELPKQLSFTLSFHFSYDQIISFK